MNGSCLRGSVVFEVAQPRRAPYQRAIVGSVVGNRDMSGLRHKSIWLEARLPVRCAGMRPQKAENVDFAGRAARFVLESV